MKKTRPVKTADLSARAIVVNAAGVFGSVEGFWVGGTVIRWDGQPEPAKATDDDMAAQGVAVVEGQ